MCAYDFWSDHKSIMIRFSTEIFMFLCMQKVQNELKCMQLKMIMKAFVEFFWVHIHGHAQKIVNFHVFTNFYDFHGFWSWIIHISDHSLHNWIVFNSNTYIYYSNSTYEVLWVVVMIIWSYNQEYKTFICVLGGMDTRYKFTKESRPKP